MLPMIALAFLVASPDEPDRSREDVQTLMATIESLQAPIEDFRCEFEGTVHLKGDRARRELARQIPLAEDGLSESFSGVFVWKRGGDMYSDGLTRWAADNQVLRETLLMRMSEQHAELYGRRNDAPFGSARVVRPTELRAWLHNCLASIFLIDMLKQAVAAPNQEVSISDGEIGGRALKVLSIALRNVPNSLIARFWIDLRRNGHVVRKEGYQSGQRMGGRLDIKLAPYKIGDADVWMPVSGENVAYVDKVDKKVVVTKEPTSVSIIYVVDGTMEFNKRPGPEVFTIKYKPGTPISDKLRKLQYEFGSANINPRPSKAEVEKMLHEQIAKAKQQGSELVVASTPQGVDWGWWIGWGCGTTLAASSVVLLVQRRRH
jgi:hypothetical protein